MTQGRPEGNGGPTTLALSLSATGAGATLPLRSALALWVADPDQWDGRGAAVLVLPDADRAMRRAALRQLLVRVPGFAAATILHREGRGPMIVRDGREVRRPALSSASRGCVAALAVAPEAVGIDVERVEPGAAIPTAALHAAEIATLAALDPADRATHFARIWSLKEAYLKAMRVGLSRDPADLHGFVDVSGQKRHAVERLQTVLAETMWHRDRGEYAISAVSLR